MTNGQGSRCDALADDVLQNICNREALIARLEKLHQHQTSNQPTNQHRVQRLLYGIHNASLAVVESISAWNLGKQEEWYRKKNIEAHADASSSAGSPAVGGANDGPIVGPDERCPFNTYVWNGQNYLQKMLFDLDFVGDIPEAISVLGAGTSFHRNPFLLSLGVGELWWAPSVTTTAWKDTNLPRARQAAFAILLDEHHREERSDGAGVDGASIGRLRRGAAYSATFYPPEIDLAALGVYTDMLDPPPTVAIAICCAHLVLGSVDADVTDKLLYLTKAIALKIFRQPLSGLVCKARAYNPLQPPEGSAHMVKLVSLFIVHPLMDPERMAGVPDEIKYLTVWMRALVNRLVHDGPSKPSSSVDKIFHELDADYQRGQPASKSLGCDDSNKENEFVSRNASVQTEAVSQSKPTTNDTSPRDVLKAMLGEEAEPKQLIPFPVAVTVNLREGSQLVSVNGALKDAAVLHPGDAVRLYDAHESSNWTVATPPTENENGSIAFSLRTAYDHSRIVAQETAARNDVLNRLCYPYKKDGDGTFVHKPPDPLPTSDERTRHVASDASDSIHSPLVVKEAKIWKLVPEDEDMRTKWRREYDDGAVPWDAGQTDDSGQPNRITHFRVRVSLEAIERSCLDSPYPLDRCVHQQRVNFFKSVPLLDVVDEAFHTVCRWHPKGTLVDNVKWAKLSRKMKFLSNVKNSKHEIDMAFVRRNEDRKLDLERFRAIFDDIASIQYPALSKEDALSKVVWASIVMLPDVNAMMWREAKRMAVSVEARRVCAQIRIAALVRRIFRRQDYLTAKRAAITLATHVRQFLARIFVAKLLRAVRADKAYQRRCQCSKTVQTAWRRFFWRSRFLLHLERRAEEKRQRIAATRAELRQLRERELASIVYRDVIRIDSTIAAVTIYFRDESYLEDANSMLLKVYVPSTRETFVFNLEEAAIRKCLEEALFSEGRLAWEEMLKENALKELTKRLMLRVVRGRPIFLFNRRNVVEKGLLVNQRVARADGEVFILSTFRSPREFAFYTYQPSTRRHMKTTLSNAKLRSWLGEPQAEGDVGLLDPMRLGELIDWLVKRVVIRENPQGDNMQLLLQFEAEEERVLKLVTKVQAQWRRLKSLRCAKDKTVRQYEKVYVRENQLFAYRNVDTDERQWVKPKLLGEEDLDEPVDEWRKEETVDPLTGKKCQYYANYATGQSSWLSEEDAARMVQRRYRSKHEVDLLGRKIQLPDIVKAMKFIHGTRAKYEQDPHKLSNAVNFALLVHCLDLDFAKAKPIYEKALQQSPNHPLIARAYGIFLLASRQAPHATCFQMACRLFREANVVDPTQTKFQSAAEIYFHWAVLVDAKNPLALLNFALLHQCIYRKYDHAEKIYRAALALDPTNTFVLENYRLFINERYPGGAYESLGPPFSVVRRSRVTEAQPEWAEWSKMVDPECPKQGMEVFWYNRFTKETRFREPNWNHVWETRLQRSRCVSGKATNWLEYYDTRTQSSFFYDVYTKRFSVHQT
ncbi:hypothetical protein ACHAXT_012891 [Thalassiosira profunda]